MMTKFELQELEKELKHLNLSDVDGIYRLLHNQWRLIDALYDALKENENYRTPCGLIPSTEMRDL